MIMVVLMVEVMGIDYSWPETKVMVGMVVVVKGGVRGGGRLNMVVMNNNGRLRTKVPKYEKMPVP